MLCGPNNKKKREEKKIMHKRYEFYSDIAT